MLRPLIVVLALTGGLHHAGAAAAVIDFDLYPDGSPVPEGYSVHDQWSSLGVVFTMGDSMQAAYAVPHVCSLTTPNHVGGDPVVLAWFVDPTTGAPAVTDFVGTAQDLCPGPGEGILMQAYDIQGQLVAQEFNSGAGHLVTFSFPEPIVAMLRMEEVGQGIDNFTFSIPVPPGSTAVPGMGSTGGRGMSLRIAPNPAVGSMAVYIHLAGLDTVHSKLCIYDPRGCLVRTLSLGPLSTRSVPWNGRDDAGNVVASGVYLVRWTGGGETSSARATIIR
jgi:hypothetical protein